MTDVISTILSLFFLVVTAYVATLIITSRDQRKVPS